jgi:hypothetical protein
MIKVWIIKMVGLLFIGGFCYIVFPFILGGNEMQSFCEAIPVGELEENLMTRADDHGYTRRELKKGKILIVDSRAMGRYICEVSISNGKIDSVTYVHNG